MFSSRFFRFVLSVFRTTSSFRAESGIRDEADEITASRFQKGFPHQTVILRIPVLQQCSLQRFLMRTYGHVDRLHGQGVQTRIVHACRDGAGRRIKILHLAGIQMMRIQIFRKRNRIREGAAGMGGHQIGNAVLLHLQLTIDLFKGFHKPLIDRGARFSHLFQNIIRDVLGSYPELAADMELTELFQKSRILVGK